MGAQNCLSLSKTFAWALSKWSSRLYPFYCFFPPQGRVVGAQNCLCLSKTFAWALSKWSSRLYPFYCFSPPQGRVVGAQNCLSLSKTFAWALSKWSSRLYPFYCFFPPQVGLPVIKTEQSQGIGIGLDLACSSELAVDIVMTWGFTGLPSTT